MTKSQRISILEADVRFLEKELFNLKGHCNEQFEQADQNFGNIVKRFQHLEEFLGIEHFRNVEPVKIIPEKVTAGYKKVNKKK